jgi:hypothetical protein
MTVPVPRGLGDDSWTREVDGWPAQLLAHIPPHNRDGEVHVHLHLHQAPQAPAGAPTTAPAPIPVPTYPPSYRDPGEDPGGYQRVREVTVRPVEGDLPHYGWWARNWPRVVIGVGIAGFAGLVVWVVSALIAAVGAAVAVIGTAVATVAPWLLLIGVVLLLLMLLGGGKGGGGTFSGTVSGTWR